ncbi:LysM peptidoglycan-binding domain-containing protein [Ligilactobacillus sp. LYQ139]|uniref:aggregation-promoting factor n=1 Tax=Ligilactobacillus sp. LYQ139 TaxID=3378800 RepID=UPI003852EF5A
MKLNKVLMSVATMAGVVAAGSVAANADTVTVQQGDTVWGFAQETNSTVSQIAQQNNLQNPNLIFVGQQLQIGQTVQQADAQAQANAEAQAAAAQQAQDAAAQDAKEQQQAAAAQAQANAEAQAAAAQQAQDAAAQAAKEQQQAAAAQAQAQAAAQAQQEAQQKAAAEAAQQKAQAEANAAAQQKQSEEQQYAQQQNRVNYNNANRTVQRVVRSTQASASTNNTSSDNNLDAANDAARAWIVARESGGNYNATNGNYYGKYQLSRSYLNGDYSPANQDRVANQYVSSRYGSWVNAENHWKQCGWY